MATKASSEAVLPAVLRFGAAYLVLNVLLVIVFALTGLTANSGVAVGALIGGAIFAGQHFARRHQRLPFGPEKTKLVFGSLIMSLIVSVLLIASASILLTGGLLDLAAGWNQVTSKVPLAYLAIGAGSICLLYLVVLWLTYGPLLGFIVRQQDKRPRNGPS